MPVEWMRKKKDGSPAYRGECQGLLLETSMCDGEVGIATKRASSFGLPFITHSYLCDAHASKLGFQK